MAGQMRIVVLNEVETEEWNGWKLCFQYGIWDGPDNQHKGYRFIWRKDGKLKPQRGQARLPSIHQARELMDKAKAAGWGDHKD